MGKVKYTPEKLMQNHIRDLKEIAIEQIRSRAMPRYSITQETPSTAKKKKKLTKKQLAALARGRKILAEKSGKVIQI